MQKLTGKVAFITGGSRGMGAAIAKRLSQEGADVIFTHSGRNPQKADEVVSAARQNGNRVRALVAGNEDSDALLTALETTVDEFGRLDILVNNAGIYSNKPINEYTLEEYDQMMGVNVKAVFVAAQFAASHMKQGGRIITVGSNMADRVGFQGGSLYAMSKSALSGLTKAIARDLGPRNITANLIQPGPVDTDMNPADSDHAPALISQTTIGRYGTVAEIAGLVAYFAGEESQFITGATFTIDGGVNV
ncbi:SDR family NAD(P)-dependent oxidoreductase [Parapedobacter tibetensis]|uniref:SDR family NAD(P)-dependent oxidoreductase n=1 Tax=Parapedobacter tibetensis TaxID=2972951 RepID=UPI00214D4092|nr:SDR family oxidoreductase [Parapedobacter tibetensis]